MAAENTPGRRLTEAGEQLAAGLFDAGKSEHEVADALGCPASTAHRLRLRLRLEAVNEAYHQDDGGLPPAELAALSGEDAGELPVLLEMRQALAEQIATTAERAEASSPALRELESRSVQDPTAA